MQPSEKDLKLERRRARVRAQIIERYWRVLWLFDRRGRYLGGDHSRTPSAVAGETWVGVPPEVYTNG